MPVSKRNSPFWPILVAILFISNLATALIAYLVVDGLDARYTHELSGKVPGLHEIVLLAQQASNTHRAAGNLLLARDAAEKKLFWARLEEARHRESEHLQVAFVRHSVVGEGEDDPTAPLRRAAQDYADTLKEFLVLVEKNDRDVAISYRLDRLRPAFDRYQRCQRDESVRLNFEALKANELLTSEAASRKTWFVGFGTWPLIALFILLIILLVLGVRLWWGWRTIEADGTDTRTDRGF